MNSAVFERGLSAVEQNMSEIHGLNKKFTQTLANITPMD